MRVLVALAILAVACNALSADQIQQLIQTDGGDESSSAVNGILLIIWSELQSLTEQMKQLTETTTALQSTTDNLQSASVLMKNRMDKLEDTVEGLTQQYQQDYADLDTKISELEQSCKENCVEQPQESYRYEISPTSTNWQDARDYCLAKGGDLAYHGINSIQKREEIICNTMQWCDYSGNSRHLWFGLQKRPSGEWEFLDGTLAQDEDVLWVDLSMKTITRFDCGEIYVHSSMHSSSTAYAHLTTSVDPCDQNRYAFCEFKV